jgi:hypothetical protein
MMEPDFTKKPPVLPVPPDEELKKFWLPPGFKLELVLAEPEIQEPAQIAFDGNGRMFVLELRGYMQTADGGYPRERDALQSGRSFARRRLQRAREGRRPRVTV